MKLDDKWDEVNGVLKSSLLDCQKRGTISVNEWKNTLDYMTYKVLELIDKKFVDKEEKKDELLKEIDKIETQYPDTDKIWGNEGNYERLACEFVIDVKKKVEEIMGK